MKQALEDNARIQNYLEWVGKNNSGVEYSYLWEECRRTFSDGNNSLRGYANNRKRELSNLARYIRFCNRIFVRLIALINLLNRAINSVISFFFAGDRVAYRKYGLHYDVDIEGLFEKNFPVCFEEYKNHLEISDEYYSYSSLRTFYYYFISRNYFPTGPKPRFLEIGAGMGNYASHIIRNYEVIEYYIVDIPEIIPSAHKELISTTGFQDVSFFLPHEYDKFLLSKSNKKVVWLLPDQLNNIDTIKFDFASNTESFAEMFPAVSQAYINFIDAHLKNGACFFSVNRATRMVGRDCKDYSSLSSPLRYSLPHCENIRVSIDHFRAIIPKFFQEPNLISLWKKND